MLATIDTTLVVRLYGEDRYIDAHAVTREQWSRRPLTVLDLSVGDALMAARLAEKLGSTRFQRALLRYAARREPNHPGLHVYGNGRHELSLFERLKYFEVAPPLETDDTELRQTWLIGNAMAYAAVRDFERAQVLLSQAQQEHVDDEWFLRVAHSHLCNAQGERTQSLLHAEAAIAIRPGHPAATATLSKALRALERAPEATRRLRELAESSQSFEVLGQAVALCMAEADVETSLAAQQRLGRQALKLCDALLPRAPLADASLRKAFAGVRAMAARLSGDNTTFITYARQTGYPGLVRLADNLSASRDTATRIVLPHPRIAQTHDTCLPASVATCLGAMGVEVDPAPLADTMTFGGTPTTHLLKWAQEQGYLARQFTLTRANAFALLERGLAFTIILTAESSAHAVAVIGIDEAAGTLLYHDPSGARTRECLLEMLTEQQAPLGPCAIAIIPPDRKSQLADLALADEREQELATTLMTLLQDGCPDLESRWQQLDPGGGHCIVEYCRAMVHSKLGHRDQAYQALLAVCEQYPESLELQAALERETARSRNLPRREQVLRRLLRGQRIAHKDDDPFALRASIRSTTFACRYAELIARSATRIDEARAIVLRCLHTAPLDAEAYAILAELTWNAGQHQDALLPYRIATCLAPSHEHYAESYARALASENGSNDALAWLCKRAAQLNWEAVTEAPLFNVVDMLEELGHHSAAIDLVREATAQRPTHGGLAARACVTLARSGYHEQSSRLLKVAQEHAPASVVLAARTILAEQQGRPEEALALAQSWAQQQPDNLYARQTVLRLLTGEHGQHAALELSRTWFSASPNDAALTQLLAQQLEGCGEHEERRRLLEHQLEQDPYNVQARLDLAFDALESARQTASAADLEAVDKLVRRCVADDPTDSRVVLLEGEVLLQKGLLQGAMERFEHAAMLTPSYNHPLARRVALAPAAHGTQASARLLEFLDKFVGTARTRGVATVASCGAEIASCVGMDAMRDAMLRWGHRFPDDPALLELSVDLQVHSAEPEALRQLAQELLRTIARHPYHRGLRLSLSWIYERQGRYDAARQEYEALCTDVRSDATLPASLASFHHRHGNARAAIAAVEQGVALAPMRSDLRVLKAAWLRDCGDTQQALETIQKAAQVAPMCTNVFQEHIQILADLGRWSELVAICDDACSKPDTPGEVLLFAARVFLSDSGGGRISRAQVLLQDARVRAPSNWDIVVEQVELFAEQGLLPEARDAVESFTASAHEQAEPQCMLAWIQHAQGEHELALRSIATTLKLHPAYEHGWQLRLDWLCERGEYQRAREVFREIPELVRSSIAFQWRGFELTRAGAATRDATVHQAAHALVASNPQSQGLRHRVYDYFEAVGEFAQARAVLAPVADEPQPSPATIVRLLSSAAQQRQTQEILRLAQLAWQRPGLSWQDAEQLGKQVRACFSQAWHLLVSDWAAHRHVDLLVCQTLTEHCYNLGFGRLLDKLAHALWSSNSPNAMQMLSYTLEWLGSLGQHGFQRDLLTRYPSRVREDRWLWAAVGHTYALQERREELVAWLGDWNDRPADHSPMYVLANYIAGAAGCGKYEQVVEVGSYALNNRRPDNGKELVLRMFYLGLVLMRPAAEFLDAWKTWGPTSESCDLGDCLHIVHEVLDEQPTERRVLQLERELDRLELGRHGSALRQRWYGTIVGKLSVVGRLRRALSF